MTLRHARPLAGLTLLLAAAPALAQPSLVVTQNPMGTSSDIVARYPIPVGPRIAQLSNVGGIRSIQSVGLAPDGTGFVTFDGVSGTRTLGGVLRIADIGTGNNSRVGGRTMRLTGSRTGLQMPKGLHVTDLVTSRSGGTTTTLALFIAENGLGTVPVHAADSTGNAAPLFTISDLGGRKPWDVFYDGAADRLFVACTDGTVLVYNNVSVDRGASTLSAVITPSLSGVKTTINLHGIDVIAAPTGGGQLLVLTDVGLASSGTDGALLAIPYTAGTTGNVNVTFINRGPNTFLGNPTDVVLLNGDAYVSEKANNRLLRFDDVATLSGNLNLAPTDSRDAAAPESVARTAGPSASADIVASLNVPDAGEDAIIRLDQMFSNVEATFDQIPLVRDLQSVGLTASGDAYFTFDGPAGTGGLIFRRGVGMATMNDDIGEGDAMVYGVSTTLNQPKGVVVVDTRQTVLVANLGMQSIVAFATDASGAPISSGDLTPSFVVSNLGMTANGGRRAVWDVHYSRSEDRLFGAGTDGVVVVFDDFFATRGANGPTRTITPMFGNQQISVNLHGIVHDRATDVLVLSDVGLAGSATDGQIFTIAAGSLASGNVAVRYRIAGPLSRLGNPVDIALSNGMLYVAEKSNNSILQFANVLTATGSVDMASMTSTDVTAPESIWLAGSTSTAAHGSTGVESGRGFAAYPNPARDRVTLRFSTETSGTATVEVYDVLGRLVAQMSETVATGEHARTFDTSSLAAGTYVLRLTAGATRLAQTLTVAR